MRRLMEQLPGTKFIDATVTVRSSLKEKQSGEVDALVDAIAATIPGAKPAVPSKEKVISMLRSNPAELLTMLAAAAAPLPLPRQWIPLRSRSSPMACLF